jgi:hypothetical protein
MIQEVDNEVGILYQEALVLINRFKLQAKELRREGTFQWYEPTVRADKNSVYITWQHIKIVRKRSGAFIAIVKHVPKGLHVDRYAAGNFGLIQGEEKELIISVENEFTRIRKHNKILMGIKRQLRELKKYEQANA